MAGLAMEVIKVMDAGGDGGLVRVAALVMVVVVRCAWLCGGGVLSGTVGVMMLRA